MKGSRPEQAVLSKDTDMSKTNATRRVIEAMVDGRAGIDGLDDVSSVTISPDGRWVATGTVRGLDLAISAVDRPWELSVTPERELRIGARLTAP